MLLWTGILVGGLFAWFAIKMGFYETWALLFNIVIAIFLAIFAGPIIAELPVISDAPNHNFLAILVTAIGSFLVLHGASYVFITGQFNVSFPKVFNIIGGGFLGFLAGFLVWSFVSFLVYITPISQNTFVQAMDFSSQLKQTSVPYISWWCNLVDKVVSDNNGQTTEQVISRLLKDIEKKKQPERVRQAKPQETREPNDLKTESNIIKKQLGPPPEAEIKDI